MENGVSVIICCYNSATRLVDTLKSIVEQQVNGVNWEVIVVDNASKDNTAEVAGNILSASLPVDKFNVVQESNPGLIHARNKGVSVARYSYLLFCDDDNWLAADYVQKAFGIMENKPLIAILGGQGEPEFEGDKPIWFDTYQQNFAVGDQVKDKQQDLVKTDEVYGAGFMIRRSFFDHLKELNFSSLLSGRKGNEVISGEDIELCFAARYLGYEVWYCRSLRFKHLMTKGRMNWEYLKKMHYGFGRMRLYTHMYQYVERYNKLPGEGLKYSLWLDKFIHRAKDLRRFLPHILFKLNEEGNDEVLKYMALKGELYELYKLRKSYQQTYQKILELKAKGKRK